MASMQRALASVSYQSDVRSSKQINLILFVKYNKSEVIRFGRWIVS